MHDAHSRAAGCVLYTIFENYSTEIFYHMYALLVRTRMNATIIVFMTFNKLVWKANFHFQFLEEKKKWKLNQRYYNNNNSLSLLHLKPQKQFGFVKVRYYLNSNFTHALHFFQKCVSLFLSVCLYVEIRGNCVEPFCKIAKRHIITRNSK